MNSYTVGTSQVLLAGALWGTSGLLSLLFPPSLSSLTIGAIRLTIGALSLAVLLGFTTRGTNFSFLHTVSLWYVLFAAIGIATTQSMIFYGIKQAGVTIAVMVFIGSAPLFSGVFSWIWDKEIQSRSWVISSSIVIIGCFFMGLSGTDDIQGMEILIGSASALLAGAGWALTGTMIKKMQQSASSLEITLLVLLGGALLLSPFAAVQGFSWIREPHVIGLSLALGVGVTALPYFLFTVGMKHIPASHAYLYGLIEPLVASLLGMIVLKERLSPVGILGYVLVSFGLLLFSLWELTTVKKSQPTDAHILPKS